MTTQARERAQEADLLRSDLEEIASTCGFMKRNSSLGRTRAGLADL
jgi:hypothetical protein